MERKPPTLRQMGAYRVLALCYPSILLGYPLVVVLLGHSLAEGWAYLDANRGFAVALLVFPVAFITLQFLMHRLMRLIGVDDGTPPSA